MRRQRQGAYANLISKLNVKNSEKFRQFHRLERQHFEQILAMICPVISKRDATMQPAIYSRERVSIRLRYLALGITFISSAWGLELFVNWCLVFSGALY